MISKIQQLIPADRFSDLRHQIKKEMEIMPSSKPEPENLVGFD